MYSVVYLWGGGGGSGRAKKISNLNFIFTTTFKKFLGTKTTVINSGSAPKKVENTPLGVFVDSKYYMYKVNFVNINPSLVQILDSERF